MTLCTWNPFICEILCIMDKSAYLKIQLGFTQLNWDSLNSDWFYASIFLRVLRAVTSEFGILWWHEYITYEQSGALNSKLLFQLNQQTRLESKSKTRVADPLVTDVFSHMGTAGAHECTYSYWAYESVRFKFISMGICWSRICATQKQPYWPNVWLKQWRIG